MEGGGGVKLATRYHLVQRLQKFTALLYAFTWRKGKETMKKFKAYVACKKLFNNYVPTSQKTQRISSTDISLLMSHSVKEERGSKGMAPLTFNLGTRWKSVVKFTPSRFAPGEAPRYPLNRELRGPQSRTGRVGVEKNLLPVPR